MVIGDDDDDGNENVWCYWRGQFIEIYSFISLHRLLFDFNELTAM